MLLRLINGPGYRRVDRDLKMLIKPIKFCLVASQCYKINVAKFNHTPINSLPKNHDDTLNKGLMK